MDMLRQIDKEDVSAMLDGMTDRVTFAKAKTIFGLPQSVLSELLKDLEFFKLVDHDGQYYQTNWENRALWERYGRELDYMVFYKSDTAKRYHESHGVNADVYDFEHTDLNKIDYMEYEDNDCY